MRPQLNRRDLIASLVIAAIVAACSIAVILSRRTPPPTAPTPVSRSESAPTPPPATEASSGPNLPDSSITAPSTGLAATTKQPRTWRTGTIIDASKGSSLADLGATPVTVDFDDLPLPEACARLSIAASTPIAAPMRPAGQQESPTVTLHLKNAPLLEALLELRDQAGVVATNSRTRGGITLDAVRGNAGLGQWCVAGPFSLVAQGGSRTVSMVGRGGSDFRGHINLDLACEPRIQIVQIDEAIVIDTFIDDKDQTIDFESPEGTTVARSLSFEFTPPDNPGQRIKLLRGAVNVTLLGRAVNLECAELSRASTQNVGKMMAEFAPVTPGPSRGTNATYVLKIRFRRGDTASDQWEKIKPMLTFRALNPAVITDAAGTRFPAINVNSTPEGPDAIVVTYQIQGTATLGEPHSYSLSVPVELQDVHVPFEFKNLVLP